LNMGARSFIIAIGYCNRLRECAAL